MVVCTFWATSGFFIYSETRRRSPRHRALRWLLSGLWVRRIVGSGRSGYRLGGPHYWCVRRDRWCARRVSGFVSQSESHHGHTYFRILACHEVAGGHLPRGLVCIPECITSTQAAADGVAYWAHIGGFAAWGTCCWEGEEIARRPLPTYLQRVPDV